MFDNKARTNEAGNGSVSTKAKFVAKGHDAILKAGQDSGSNINIMTTGGLEIVGKLVNRDKFTITVEYHDGGRATVYKHAIESFTISKASV